MLPSYVTFCCAQVRAKDKGKLLDPGKLTVAGQPLQSQIKGPASSSLSLLPLTLLPGNGMSSCFFVIYVQVLFQNL